VGSNTIPYEYRSSPENLGIQDFELQINKKIESFKKKLEDDLKSFPKISPWKYQPLINSDYPPKSPFKVERDLGNITGSPSETTARFESPPTKHTLKNTTFSHSGQKSHQKSKSLSQDTSNKKSPEIRNNILGNLVNDTPFNLNLRPQFVETPHVQRVDQETQTPSKIDLKFDLATSIKTKEDVEEKEKTEQKERVMDIGKILQSTELVPSYTPVRSSLDESVRQIRESFKKELDDLKNKSVMSYQVTEDRKTNPSNNQSPFFSPLKESDLLPPKGNKYLLHILIY